MRRGGARGWPFIAGAPVHRGRCAPRPWRGSRVAIGRSGGAGGLTSSHSVEATSGVTPERERAAMVDC